MNELNRADILILVVDDDPEVLRSTARLLEKKGYAVNRAADGEEALRSVQADHPAMLLLDRSLPGIDGLEVCRRIKQDPTLAHILVIIASGKQIESNDQAEGFEAGADGYIARPIANCELLARVEAYARIVKLNRELRVKAELLQKNTTAALQAQDASLNLMEDAVEAQNRLITVNQDLLSEIAERKRLESMTIQLAAIVQSSDDAIIGKDLNGIITSWNPSAERLFGFAASEMNGTSIGRLIPVNRRDEENQILGKISRGERVAHFETQRQCKDGRLIEVSVTVSPILNAAGKIIGASKVVRDITERKQAEVALRASEERYRLLFERAPDIIFALAPTGAITSLNHAFETITGWSPARWLGRPFQQFIHPDDETRAGELFQVVLRGERVPTFELRVRTTVGGHRDIEFTGFSSQFSGGRIEVQGIGRDITERKAGERQLREQNEILSNSHEGVMIVNLANEVLLWNCGAGEIFGWTQAEALGRPPEQLLGINELGVVSTLRAAVEREGFWNGDMRMQTRDGRKLIVDCRITLVRDEAGRPRARLAFLTDITEKKLLEGKFLRVQRLESIGTLAGGVAHDLNNALAPILLGVELIKQQYPKESQIVDMFQTSARRGADMVRQLLTFAKGAEGERVLLRPGHLVKELEHLMKGSFPKNIQLVVRCDPKLPTVLGDATQLHQVLLNLCVNARDAMPHGGTLTLEAQSMEVDAIYASSLLDGKPGKYVVLRVRDTGTGIPPEIIDRIFDPFFTTKGPDKGTGLGLFTVIGIVKGHGGFLQVDSQPGQGSTFAVYLPAADAGNDTEHVTKAVAGFRGHGETILFVEDDASVRKVGCAVLRRLNFNPMAATDGADGLIRAAENRTELRAVITDLHMPHMDGLAFVHALRRMLPDIPVIVVSGRMEDTMAEEFKTLGVTSRLDKPFTEQQLAEALKTVLQK